MSNDVYDYTKISNENTSIKAKSSLLSKTYTLLALSFIPCAVGAYLSSNTGVSILSISNNKFVTFGILLAFFYGMCFLIEKNRHNNFGIALLMIFTLGMGFILAPTLQYALSFSNGTKIIGITSLMTAALFFTMAGLAHRTNVNMRSLSNFLFVGFVVLMVGIVANLFLQMPALVLALSVGFVIFSSVVILYQIKMIIDGGETSYISAALTIFISIYNIFSSLLNILLSIAGDD